MPGWIVLSDLDGTLLDSRSYSFRPAQGALRRLERAGIPVVLVSSKSRAEMEPIRKSLKNSHPFIVENGAAVVVPKGYFPKKPSGFKTDSGAWVLELGWKKKKLLRALRGIAEKADCGVRPISKMSPREIVALTGLDKSRALLAKKRMYSEPFLILSGSPERLGREARNSGMKVLFGGRFQHLLAGSDKGKAAGELLKIYRKEYGRVRSAAIGDSPNDLPFLKPADLAFAVERPEGGWHPGLKKKGVARVEGSGPRGWRAAAEKILDLL